MIPIDSGVSGARRAAARRALIRQLKRAEAYGLDRTVELEVHNRMEERMLARLVKRGIVKPGTRGGYWLDVERYRECRKQELIFAVGAILVATGIMACMFLYAKPREHHHPRAETQVVFPFP